SYSYVYPPNSVGITHLNNFWKWGVPVFGGLGLGTGIPEIRNVDPTEAPPPRLVLPSIPSNFAPLSPDLANPGTAPLLNLTPGGVLIDQAAQLVGANIKDITGATFDPVTHQLVFLGNSNPSTLHDVNLDYFYTAIQSVYGSAVPPYVTLDP